MPHGKTNKAKGSSAGGHPNQGIPRHDRAGHHQISDRPFHLRQHLPVRLGAS